MRLRSLDALCTAFAEERITEDEFVTMFRPLYESTLRSNQEWITDPDQESTAAAIHARILGTDDTPAREGLRALVRELTGHG